MTLDVAAVAQLACLLEVSAPKPGNVGPGHHFADARYEDFLASAAAIGTPLRGAGERPLGITIRLACEATSRWTRSNTNLGIVLLLAPLARAAFMTSSATASRGFDTPDARVRAASTHISRDALRQKLTDLLSATTVEDARNLYAGIRLASPGGLGQTAEQDISTEPTISLLDTMRLAADRDDIAREYVTNFETTFTIGAPAIDEARRHGLPWNDAVVETFLTILAGRHDTHIARRGGVALAEDVSRRARTVIAAGGVRSAAGRDALREMDEALRREGNVANPGTSADLTAAAIFVALLGDSWRTSDR